MLYSYIFGYCLKGIRLFFNTPEINTRNIILFMIIGFIPIYFFNKYLYGLSEDNLSIFETNKIIKDLKKQKEKQKCHLKV